MSSTVSCPGCARAVALADADNRPQIRCPACGFVFARPAVTADAITAAAPRPRRSDAIIAACGHCGEALSPSTTRCPQCGNAVKTRNRPKKARRSPATEGIKAPETYVAPLPEDHEVADDDGDAYRVANPGRPCPNCKRTMEHATVVCLGCGYNSATGDQALREYEPVARSWDGGMPLRRRFCLFGAGQAFSIALVVGAYFGDFLVMGLVSWGMSSLLLAYILGTFSRVEVIRSRRGQVFLTKRWHFCFVPLKPMHLQILQYEGVRVGVARDADLWDWVLFFILLGYGLIPGVIWWYCAFQRDLYFVGLLQNHGGVAVELYRGWNEALARDMGQVVRNVGGFT